MKDLVILSTHNTPVTTSLIVAEAFGKRHDHVLRDIRALAAEAATAGDALKIGGVSYLGGNGEERPMYTLDEEAFSLLVMGFTGAQALEWKRKFYAAFKALRDKLTPIPSDPIKLIEYTLARLKEETAARQKAEATIKRATEVFQDHLLPAHKAQRLITASKELYTPREAAKVLSMGPKSFLIYLEQNNWIWRNRNNDIVPMQDKIDRGLLVYKYYDYKETKEYYDLPHPNYRAQVLLTSRGVDRLAREIAHDRQ